jgi:transposase InsO family protein
MKDSYPNVRLVRLCRLFGVTRQAYYQQGWRTEELQLEALLVVTEVRQIRSLHPVIGGRKLYALLQPFLLEHQIKIGRDALFDLLATYRLLVRKTNTAVRTTNSYHRFHKYPNLIKGKRSRAVNQLWVSDITYCKTAAGFAYISFVTDDYSKKIVGYHAAETLEAVHSIKALKMALANNKNKIQGLIHHSDRGIQYCCDDYIKLLTANKIQISMTESGDPLENAVAERLNGIIKEEYLNHYPLNNIGELERRLSKAVQLYNTQRPHLSCNYLTPAIVHENKLAISRDWKNYYLQKRSTS